MNLKLDSLIDKNGQSFLDSFEGIMPSDVADSFIGDIENAENFGFSSFLQEILSAVWQGKGELASFFLFVLGTVALMSAASLVSGKFARATESAIMIISGVGMFAMVYSLVSETTEALGGVLSFFTSFLPIMTGVIAYGGGVASASACASGANMTLGIIGSFVLPLMNSCASLIFALGLIGTLGNGACASFSVKVKNFFMWLVGLCSVLLLSSLALQTVLTSSSDTAAMRAAKYAASGTIPIVGGSVSAAMGTLVTSAVYIKNTIGTCSLAVVFIIAFSPLIMLIAYRFIISFGEGILDFLGISFGAKMFSSFRSAFDVLIAVFAMTVMVLIIEIALMMKSGVSAF